MEISPRKGEIGRMCILISINDNKSICDYIYIYVCVRVCSFITRIFCILRYLLSLTCFQHMIYPLPQAQDNEKQFCSREVLGNTLKAQMSFMIRIVISDVFAPASTSTVSAVTLPKFRR